MAHLGTWSAGTILVLLVVAALLSAAGLAAAAWIADTEGPGRTATGCGCVAALPFLGACLVAAVWLVL